MAVHFISTTEKTFLNGKPLFKIVMLPYAGTLFCPNTPCLWFASPKIWEDPFERRFVQTQYRLPTGVLVDYPLKDRVFCSCFSKERIVESQWNKYCGNPGCYPFEIKVCREELLKQLKVYSKQNSCNIYLGPVKYQMTAEIEGSIRKNGFLKNFNLFQESSAVRLLFLKRNAFIDEGEFRIVIVHQNDSAVDGISVCFNCQPNELIQCIVKHPKYPEPTCFFNFLKNNRGFGDYIGKNGQKCRRIVKSGLYNKHIPQFVRL